MVFFLFVFMIAGLINFLSIVDISRTSCHLLAPTVTSKDEKVYWKKKSDLCKISNVKIHVKNNQVNKQTLLDSVDFI